VVSQSTIDFDNQTFFFSFFLKWFSVLHALVVPAAVTEEEALRQSGFN
jgi:hypothetical protein